MADAISDSKQEATQARWIDLNDSSGARLKLASIDVGGQSARHLFITNLAWSNPKWAQCLRELGFKEAPSRRYLVRRMSDADRVSLRPFTKIFPRAHVRDMPPSEYILGYGKTAESRSDNRQARIDLQGAKRLGRNADGLVVYESVSGRFLHDEDSGRRINESDSGDRSDYLRLPLTAAPFVPGTLALHQALEPIAKGLVRGMQRGEPMHSEHIRTLLLAAFGDDVLDGSDFAGYESSLFDAMHEALLVEMRAAHERPSSAYLEAARIHDYQPAFSGIRPLSAMVPLPLALAAQQMLGDVSGQVVVLPNRWDGALAAFLQGAKVRAWQAQSYGGPRRESIGTALDEQGTANLMLQEGGYSPAECGSADALLLNADPITDEYGQRQDQRLALQGLRHLKRGGRAVLLLRGDDTLHPGRITDASSEFLREIMQRYVVQDAWEAAPILLRKTGDGPGVRVLLVQADAPDGEQTSRQMALLASAHLPVMASWNAIKTHVDERIQALNLQAPSAKTEEDERDDRGDYQRPYMAFSRMGEARTMVPANLQAPLQQYMTSLESRVGPVDDFVSEQIGMGKASLMSRFSPEQIDGVAIMLSRLLIGRSSILADDTGIGKGRQLAALAVWANKSGRDVIFVTDRANLFSDLARDLNDIGEWDRFSPLVFNADGEITVDGVGPDAPAQVLAKGEPPASLRRIIEEDLSMRDAGRNICFLTYSQINTEESEKARWVKNHAKDALVIFDEAHVCAGSDSNMALHAAEIAASASAVQFASATWAKTPDNLHVYQRAFPSTVAVSTLSETMLKGGETFSEVFSGMLGLEGALIRREHDLSRLEVELLVDEDGRIHNERVSDLVADVLGSAAYLAGEMEQVFIRTNADSVKTLRQARDARSAALPRSVKLFNSSFGAGSVVYQIMKGVQGSLNAGHVARLAVESLQKGMKPVIVSDATGESLLEKLNLQEQIDRDANGAVNGTGPGTPAEGDTLGGRRLVRMPTLRDLLRDVLVKRLTTVRVREVDAADLIAPDELDAQGAADWTAEGAGQGQDGAGGDAAPARRQRAGRTDEAPSEEDEGELIGLAEALSAAQIPQGAQRAIRKARWREASIFEADGMTDDLVAVYERGIQEIERKIEAVPDIPVNAMDVIEQAIRDAGYRVGEITGRKNQLVKAEGVEGPEKWRMQARTTHKRAVKASIKAFNDGALDALLINRAAASGVSLHASPRFADRSRRHLIEHMIPEDPVNRVQLLGRVNRYDQVSSPLITTASTGIYGEVRYLMMQNRKLARMSANVRSSRDNAMSLKGVVDLFNTVGARAVRSYMQDSPLVSKRLGFDSDEIDRLPDVVNKVTMRIPLLTVAQQKQVYEEIYSRFDEIVLREEMEGAHPLKPTVLDVGAKTKRQSLFMGDDEVETGEMGEQTALFASAFDAPVWAKNLTWEEDLKPLSWRGVRAAAESQRAQMLQDGLVEIDEEDGRINSDGEEYLLLSGEDETIDLDDDEEASADDVFALLQRDLLSRREDYRARTDLPKPHLKGEIVSAVLKGFDGMRRLMRVQSIQDAQSNDGPDASDNDVRLADESAAYKRALMVHEWMSRNLHKLVPGASVTWAARNEHDVNAVRPDYIITSVQVPPREQWMHLGKWRITMAARGFERAREFSLRSLLSEVDGDVFRGAVSMRGAQTVLFGPVLRDGIYGSPAKRLADEFDTAPKGRRVRNATMLTGNLYLASEWAAATGKGRSVIYTDESGMRHRGILMPRDMESIRADLLPVRVADGAIQRRLLQALLHPRDSDWLLEEQKQILEERFFHILDLSFKSAIHRMRGGVSAKDSAAVAILVPSVGIGISMTTSDLRRVAASLRAAQKKMDQNAGQEGASARAHVSIVQYRGRRGLPKSFANALATEKQTTASQPQGEFGEKQAVRSGLLLLKAETPEQIDRALRLLGEHAGLEIYAATQPYREMARDISRITMRERRRQMAEAQASMLVRQANPSAPLQPATPRGEPAGGDARESQGMGAEGDEGDDPTEEARRQTIA